MDDTLFPYGLVYGPHASKRLGVSMGVDLTPMVCTFNCVYCERGRTLYGCRDPQEFIPKVGMKRFVDALRQRVTAARRVDCLTFAGTGEPTLEPRLGEFIASARGIIGQVPIKVITNSSLLTNPQVVRKLAEADEVIAKLNAVSNDVFTQMHRPFDEAMNSERILRGLHALKEEIGDQLTVEILFIHTYQPIKINSTNQEVENLTAALRELRPNRVQIHTIRRFPAEPYVLRTKRRFLDIASTHMKKRLPKTEVSTHF